MGMLDTRAFVSPRHVDCDHNGSADRGLLSVHRTSAGTVSYLRCSCGAWLVLQGGDLLRVVVPPSPREVTRVHGGSADGHMHS
jgi:hypothetical protein